MERKLWFSFVVVIVVCAHKLFSVSVKKGRGIVLVIKGGDRKRSQRLLGEEKLELLRYGPV